MASFTDYSSQQLRCPSKGVLSPYPLSSFQPVISYASFRTVVTASIGFPFVFENDTYTQAYVNSSGCIQLIGSGATLLSGSTSSDCSQLYSMAFQDPVLASWWVAGSTADSVYNGGVYVLTTPMSLPGHTQTIFRFITYGTSATPGDVNSAYLHTHEIVLNTLGQISFNYVPQRIVGFGSMSDYNALIGMAAKSPDGNPRYKLLATSVYSGLTGSNLVGAPWDWPALPNLSYYLRLSPPLSNLPVFKADTSVGRYPR
jgi:hypothetical protein